MKTFDSYRLHITPLSPVHIGTGESYEPTNYVIEDGILHEFDTGATVAALSASEREKLLGIANRRPNTEMIQALQRFFHERREALMAYAVQQVPVLPGVATLYAGRVGQTANREADGKKVLNRLEIDRTSFNPITRQPVLYGSSLKGAIRTALLDKVNNGQPARERERKGLHEFQGRLFRYYDENARPRMTLERDPMRLVQLADATWRGEPGLPASQVHLAVNRKKAPVVDEKGALRKSTAESKDLYQILECVSGGHYRAFSGQLNLQSLDGLGEPRANRLPAADLRFTAQQIAQACNRFYRPILEAENRLLRERGYLDANWDAAIQKLLAAADERMRRGEVFLLRIGRHSGAESVTLNGVRSIKIMKGKDQQPDHLDAAKTVWLAANDKDQMTGLLPFGWLLVELHPMAEQGTDWPELQTACAQQRATALALKEKLAQQRARLERAKAQAEAKRREEQEKARLAEEAEARRKQEEAERQARRQRELEQLSPIEKEIQVFLDERADKNQPEISAVIGAVKQGKWTNEKKIEVAKWLEKTMRASKGEWKERSQAKKPEKDREYQNTLLVKGWLADQ